MSQPAKPRDVSRDELFARLVDFFSLDDTYWYHLTRVKEGFAVGTVTLDDFVEIDEDTVNDLVDFLRSEGDYASQDEARIEEARRREITP